MAAPALLLEASCADSGAMAKTARAKRLVVLIGKLWRSTSVTAGLFPCNSLSNCACGFPAHSLTMILMMWLASDSARYLAADADPLRTADRRSMPSGVLPVARPA